MVLTSSYKAVADANTEALNSLSIQPKSKEPADATVDIHCLPTNDGIIVKVTPPREWDTTDRTSASAAAPAQTHPPHVPCDIVLVIDVSGSMCMDAPVPTAEGEAAESHGLSVLDLTKHAAHTICETLNDKDRLAIVTFSSNATVLQPLTPMTADNKRAAASAINAMRPDNLTNLWYGILTGIKQLNDRTGTDGTGDDDTHRVPAIMVLTDGAPNHMSPAQGYVPKMRTMPPCPAPIHTFGFGYQLRSGLLKSIAEFTGGNYAFIPDAGMIGTVFVHAMANLQSTFAADAVVHLTMPDSVTLTETLGAAVPKPPYHQKRRAPPPLPRTKRLTVHVGTLVYGQSRDIYLRYAIAPDDAAAAASGPLVITAELEYGQLADDGLSIKKVCLLPGMEGGDTDDENDSDDDVPRRPSHPLTAGEAAFHVSRAQLCRFIASYFPLNDEDEHGAVDYRPSMPREVAAFAAALPAGQPAHARDPMCQALMADVAGQVTMALSDPDHYKRWGRHYLPSLQGAHAVQQCNSFKDPGPQLYAAHSPLFVACRNALDAAFDTLPPPQPEPPAYAPRHQFATGTSPPPGIDRRGNLLCLSRGPQAAAPKSFSRAPTAAPSFSMSRYHNARGPCFASFCRVSMADGSKAVRVNRLRRGMLVQTPRGPRAVRTVLKTAVSRLPMVAIGHLLITAWHPVSHNGADWLFPCKDKKARRQHTPEVHYTGCIYSILLEPDDDVDAHALKIEGVWAVTLGHGLTDNADARNPKDVRIHSFLGDYAAVSRSLAALDVRRDGLVVNGGSVRSNYRKWHTRK